MTRLTRTLDARRYQSVILELPEGQVRLRIVDIRGSGPNGRARIGVAAPAGITVDRLEVHELKRASLMPG